MPQFSGFLDLMDSRSFASIWYWLAVIGVWSLAGRAILGVPVDILNRARRDPGGQPGMVLLDWLSLTMPRGRIGAGDMVWLLALGGFVLTSLAILGFGYGLQMAQALTLLLWPFALLLVLRQRLSHRVLPVLKAAQTGNMAPEQAAGQITQLIALARRWEIALSILAVGIAALWGTWWGLMHPNGM